MWNDTNSKIIEYYYQAYLEIVKYILGFAYEGALLGRSFLDSQINQC